MSFYLIELYSPKASWLSLSQEQRSAFLEGVGQEMGTLASLGVEVLALSQTQSKVDQASPHQFIGIWRFPNEALRTALLAGIEASGWYRYFDHINVASNGGDAPSHLQALIAL